MKTPVLFIIFNRLETTKKVFARIREAKPSQLFIAADGPRPTHEGEAQECQEVRTWVLNNIDWECEVNKLFRTENLGCGRGPAESITWFFEQVTEGVILEDDCLPSISFFAFCEELLEKYRNDERIMLISGTTPHVYKNKNFDYFFSKFGTTWGWASWQRAWKKFDYDLTQWESSEVRNNVLSTFQDPMDKKHYDSIFNRTYSKDGVTWWDYQWLFARILDKGLSILPVKNQISNVGFGKQSTHTSDPLSPDNLFFTTNLTSCPSCFKDLVILIAALPAPK